jgi:hypothetical protein
MAQRRRSAPPDAKCRQQRLCAVLPGAQGNAISGQQRYHVAMMNARKIKGQQA